MTLPPPPPALVFTHTCNHIACRDPGCRLCARAPRKLCTHLPGSKVSIMDAAGVRAPCGAVVRVAFVTKPGGPRCSERIPDGAVVQLCMVHANTYDAAVRGCLVPAAGHTLPRWLGGQADASGLGGNATAHFLVAAIDVSRVAASASSSPLASSLVSDDSRPASRRPLEPHRVQFGNYAHTPPHHHHAARDAVLHTVRWTAASDKLALACSRSIDACATVVRMAQVHPDWQPHPPAAVRLAACLLDGTTGAPYDAVPAVSDPFVVHSQSPRLVKAEVACVTDAVTVLPGMGHIAARHLANLPHTNLGYVLPPDVASLCTVADLRCLAAHLDPYPDRDAAVRHALGLSRPTWNGIKEAAVRAVERDTRLRAWFTHTATHGLVFSCVDGVPDMAAPIVALAGIKSSQVPPNVATLPLPIDSTTPGDSLVGYGFKENHSVNADVLAAMTADARTDWHREGHPGWTVVSAADGVTFDDLAQLRAYVARNIVQGVAVLNLQADVKPRQGRLTGDRLRFWT